MPCIYVALCYLCVSGFRGGRGGGRGGFGGGYDAGPPDHVVGKLPEGKVSKSTLGLKRLGLNEDLFVEAK